MDNRSNSAPPLPQDEHKPFGFSWYLGSVLLLLLLYVLSLGPAERLYVGRKAPPAVVGFYKPLKWLGRTCGPARHFLDWYVYGVWVRPLAQDRWRSQA